MNNYVLGGRPRSLSITTAPDTDYVLLQPSPIYHWVPVHDEPESSDDSSQDSMTNLHRSNSQRSLTSQRSVKSTYSYGNRTRKRSTNVNSRPSSLLISPPASPRPAYRSKSTDEYSANNVATKQTPSAPVMSNTRHSTPTIADDITITVPVATTNLEKFTKLKDRLMGTTVPTSHQPLAAADSDDESTPLVSELSTPSHTQSDSVFIHALSPTSDLSSASIKSLPQTGERSADVDDYDTVSLVIHESMDSRSYTRQNAEEWDSPETPV